MGVPIIRTVVFWVYIEAPLFWETTIQPPIMENQMDNKMENDMETGIIQCGRFMGLRLAENEGMERKMGITGFRV